MFILKYKNLNSGLNKIKTPKFHLTLAGNNVPLFVSTNCYFKEL